MSTTWYEVHFAGATIGFSAYHGTSDTWLPGILWPEALKAGSRHEAVSRRCACDNASLHWVSLRLGSPPLHKVAMLACLRCHVLELPPFDADDYVYKPYPAETLARARNEEPR